MSTAVRRPDHPGPTRRPNPGTRRIEDWRPVDAAYLAFLACYLFCLALTRVPYLRPTSRPAGV